METFTVQLKENERAIAIGLLNDKNDEISVQLVEKTQGHFLLLQRKDGTGTPHEFQINVKKPPTDFA